MKKIIIFFALFTILFCVQTQQSPLAFKSKKIVNGQNAVDSQFPHQAYLVITKKARNSILCGGSLIDKSWILSAAHCIEGASRINVSLGSISASSFPVQIIVESRDKSVINFFPHEYYNPTSLANDIALIRLPNPVTVTNNIKPIGFRALWILLMLMK